MTSTKSHRSNWKGSGQYTKPDLRERLKRKIQNSSKGGRAGQWSARKSQLLASEYKKAGGGYRGRKNSKQRSLDQWTKEEWTTQSGSARARHGRTTSRYLPKKAWSKLSPSERKATEQRKKSGSRHGRQYVTNTRKAKSARRRAAS